MFTYQDLKTFPDAGHPAFCHRLNLQQLVTHAGDCGVQEVKLYQVGTALRREGGRAIDAGKKQPVCYATGTGEDSSPMPTLNRRSLIGLGAVLPGLLAGSMPRVLAETVMMQRTYVLVHGAWHGGWCWDRVAPLLRSAGHRVFTPTQSGLGERARLLTRDVGLEAFLQDIIAVIEMEELTDVILVGHSFAGRVITSVADRIPDRISQLVYLDAGIPESGKNFFSIVAAPLATDRIMQSMLSSAGLTIPVPQSESFGVTDPSDAGWLTPHVHRSFTDLGIGSSCSGGA